MAEEIKKSWYKHWWGILIILFFTSFLILLTASGFYFFDRINYYRNNPLPQSNKTGQYQNTAGENNYSFGTSTPKLTIVEFADFACPYSKQAFPKLRELGIKYKDTVKIVYRDYPLTTEASIDLALSARCAGEQGYFWPMHDKLFQSKEPTKESAIAMARQIDLDMKKFNSCMETKKYLPAINKNILDANEFGVKGTPTWFFNGHKIEGDMTLDIMEKAIQELIK